MVRVPSTHLEDFSGNSSSSSSKGPAMSGSSLCWDARKLNISKVAFLMSEGERKQFYFQVYLNVTNTRKKEFFF